MKFYNYMLVIQQEALKAIVKKGLNIGYHADKENGVVFLTDPAKQSAFCIPQSLFVLDASRLKKATTLADRFNSAALGGHSIGVTPEIWQSGKSVQLKKLYDPEMNIGIWVDNRFLRYFKNCKNVMYNYFEYRGAYIVFAYDSSTFEVLGITINQVPKR